MDYNIFALKLVSSIIDNRMKRLYNQILVIVFKRLLTDVKQILVIL